MIKYNKSGYILALTLALIALFMVIATYIANKGLVFSSFSRTMVDREKARQLALGGIQLAMSQLATVEKKPQAAAQPSVKADDKKPAQEPEGKQLLKILLPQLGRVQKFNLKPASDGISGTVGFMITSEEGKINLNRLYDFEKHKYSGQTSAPATPEKKDAQEDTSMRKALQALFAQIKEQTGADLFAEFEKFMRERKYPINDVTELLAIPGFELFKNNIFFDPAAQEKKMPLYLADIFTVNSSKQSIEPWLISHSLQQLLKFPRNEQKNSGVDEILKTFKDKNDWKNDWNKSLKNWYGIEFGALPSAIIPLLNPVFDPKMFSVVAFGTVGAVTVRLLALLEREKTGKDGQIEVKIRQMYVI